MQRSRNRSSKLASAIFLILASACFLLVRSVLVVQAKPYQTLEELSGLQAEGKGANELAATLVRSGFTEVQNMKSSFGVKNGRIFAMKLRAWFLLDRTFYVQLYEDPNTKQVQVGAWMSYPIAL